MDSRTQLAFDIDEVEKRVRVTGTFVGNDLIDVDGIQLAEPRPALSVKF